MPREAKVSVAPSARTGSPYERSIPSACPRIAATPLNPLATQEGKHKCPFKDCGKCFARESDLGRHLMTHIPALQFKCPWPDCKKATDQGQWGNLRVHVCSHASVRLNECTKCKGAYIDPSTVTHHGQRKVCSRGKTRSAGRKGSSSKRKPSLRNHKADSHPAVASTSDENTSSYDLQEGPIAGPSDLKLPVFDLDTGAPIPGHSLNGLDRGIDSAANQLADVNGQYGFWTSQVSPSAFPGVHPATVSPALAHVPIDPYTEANWLIDDSNAHGGQYFQAGTSAQVSSQTTMHPQQYWQASGDNTDTFPSLDGFHSLMPQSVAQPVPVPAFEPTSAPISSYPNPMLPLDPAQHEFMSMQGTLNDLDGHMQPQYFDGPLSMPAFLDPYGGAPMTDEEFAFYSAQLGLPIDDGLLLNLPSDMSNNVVNASEASMWYETLQI